MNTFLDLTPNGHKNSFRRDRRYKTDWHYMLFIAIVALVAGLVLINQEPLPQPTELITVYDIRESKLQKLMMCESSGRGTIMGDNGDSSGYYQWQKPSLEDVMSVHYGERVALTHDQWISVSQNYEEAHYWTYYAIYELNQGWRWHNCWVLGKQY